jgi:LPXTG-motif cell wall-anchored protein
MYGGELPYTGSVLTLPLALIGLVLSVGGWLIGRRDRTVAKG